MNQLNSKYTRRGLGRLWLLGAGILLISASIGQGAGILSPVNATDQALQIRDHQVKVTINNGFARTEVSQSFFNPNPAPLEAIYEMPLPKEASLSEISILAGETILNGEVVSKEDADRIYQEEKNQGNSAGKADKVSYQRFEFYVYPVPANGEVSIRTVYYQPLEIDTGIGRYVYAVEEGGTDEQAEAFWLLNDTVTDNFSIDVELKSAWPITQVRTPNYNGTSQQNSEGHYTYQWSSQGGTLDTDFVLYYRLADNLPGRVEVIPYKPSKDKPGTFMAVLTPGLDLKPLTMGSDYIFVLDTSGSMSGKLASLVSGMRQAIGQLKPHDRFRIVAFSSTAHDLTNGMLDANEQNVQYAFTLLDGLSANQSTNLYAGLQTGLNSLDNDRAASLIIVTDGVTNTGVVDPRRFHDMMAKYDVRVFGFLLGNSGNWPLMKTICDATGGFYAGVSNTDDILGKILQAKEKVVYESLLNAEIKVSGVRTHDITGTLPKKIFRGEQLILLGRYENGGKARISLNATLTGEDKTYTTEFDLPNIDTDNPELERLWATARIEELEGLKSIGQLEASEARSAIRDLGVAYQLVTDETSMIVLSDEQFTRHNIERNNQERVQAEHKAQQARAQAPVKSYRVDEEKPAFKYKAPSFGGGGGGALGPLDLLWFIPPAIAWIVTRRKRSDGSRS